jgi:hypothetical protein
VTEPATFGEEKPAFFRHPVLWSLVALIVIAVHDHGSVIRGMSGPVLRPSEPSEPSGTSPAQLYRLLDPTNHTKSMRQLLSLLHLLGFDVDVEVKPRPRVTPS